MTDCSLQLTLTPLSDKPVWVRNDGGAITSNAGVLLLRAVDERLGLTARLAACLPDGREPGKVQHSVLRLLRQRLYQIACGYEDCNDADQLRRDPAFKLAVGQAPGQRDLASQPSLSRLENAVDSKDCRRLGQVLLESYTQRHRAARPRQIVLDVDATDDPTHGQQSFSAYHGFYQEHCYLPLLVFAQREGQPEQELLVALLRPGNRHAGHRALAVLKRVVAHLRQAFPRCRLHLRADSGLALPEVYDGCEQLQLPYTLSLPRNPRLQRLAEPWLQQAREQYAQCQSNVQVFGAFWYAAEGWPHERRVIVKAEVMPQGENLRFVVTSDRKRSPRAIYKFYAQRGDPENRIKELKHGVHADRLSCHTFWANQFRLLLYAAAYVLLQALRAGLAGTELARAQVTTLQLRLLKVGARVIESVRRVWVHLPSTYPCPHLWQRLARAGPA